MLQFLLRIVGIVASKLVAGAAGAFVFLLVFLGLGTQALVGLLGLLEARRRGARGVGRKWSNQAVVALVVIALAVGWWNGGDETVVWYGLNGTTTTFGLLFALLGAVWAWVGVHRQLADALQLRQLPSAWLGFCGFLPLFLGGFWVKHFSAASVTLLAGAAVVTSLVLSYVAAFLAPTSLVRIRLGTVALQGGDLRRGFEHLPVCVSSWLFGAAALSIAGLGVDTAFGPLLDGLGWASAWITGRTMSIWSLGLGALLLGLRDLGLLYFFRLGPRPAREQGDEQ